MTLSPEYYKERANDRKQARINVALGIIAAVAIIAGIAYTIPNYRVWSAEKRGMAELAEARHNRQIQIEEAQANLEAQKLNSEAEVERAKGMAEAIEIEDGKLTERYIQYLWVRTLDETDAAKIYIATEANLPILEAQP